jgi:hypothetical protein
MDNGREDGMKKEMEKRMYGGIKDEGSSKEVRM